MKNKIMLGVFVFTLSLFTVSCENQVEDYKDESNTAIQKIEDFSVREGRIGIMNVNSLVDVMNKYQKNDSYQKTFDDKIKLLQKQGFQPLTPFFNELSENQIAELVVRKSKRIAKRKQDFGINIANMYSREGEAVISLDDDIIYDPAFASILNEEREIVI